MHDRKAKLETEAEEDRLTFKRFCEEDGLTVDSIIVYIFIFIGLIRPIILWIMGE